MIQSRPALAGLALIATIGATATRAGDYPQPPHSTGPTTIRLVGSSNGIPDVAAGEFLVLARTLVGSPAHQYPICVDFSECFDVVLCAEQMDPAVTVNCETKWVRKYPNLNGEVRFTIMGRDLGLGAPASLLNCAKIYGIPGPVFARPTVAVFDLDGSGEVDVGDLSVWLTDFGSGIPYGRSDYDGTGIVGAGDLSDWLTVWGRGTSVLTNGTSCP